MSRQFNTAAGLLGAVFLLTAPGSAIAEGWSVGVGIGESKLDDFCEGAGGISCDDTDTGTKIFVGYDLNENFRVEGFRVDFGEVEASNGGLFVEAEADGFGVAAMPMLPASEHVDLFGKIGLLRWDAKSRTNAFGPTETFSDDGTDPFFGFGIRGQLGEQFAIRGEWEQYDLDGDDVRLLSVGVELRF